MTADLERYFGAGGSVLMVLFLMGFGLWCAWRVYVITRTRRWGTILRIVHEYAAPIYPMFVMLALFAVLAVLSVAIGWTLEHLNLWPFWLAPATS
ncbi:hypothetical protein PAPPERLAPAPP_04790 [Brevundimonas phage vB_BpoS-Papperlapapp]|uniref:Uncharacterized protein n=2 Tax=Marchewkavirus TaxID=3425052 RepID=A0A9E7SJ98_9CAUD|nr:hypothetical protein KABACHOK_03170 [Brevundimonas phage vB_BpoS-Kabachok]USN14848.1 hypothetical protein DOMOVOI_03740 [Brevundimonas phage vB_BpoS-Domovoi]USN16220.1 hypothetical protein PAPPERLAPAPP_04790 [Brevundimonas phage vB_BpoS-Papperlapapp]